MQRFLSVSLALALIAVIVAGCDSGSGIPSDLGENSTLAFVKTSDTAPEDTSSYSVDIVVNDPGFKELTVDVVLSEASTVDPSEVELPENTTLTFPESTTAGETRTFTFEVIDDDTFLEGDETIVLELRNASGASPDEAMSTFTLTVTEDDLVLPIADARDRVGEEVVIEGTVTRAFGDFTRLQDESGATDASGLYIRQTSGAFFDDVQDGTITEGTELQIRGTVGEFNGNIQINEGDLTSYDVQGQGSVPAPQTVTLDDLETSGEDYENELVQITGLEFPSASGTFDNGTNYDVTDGTTTLTLRVQSDSETQVGGTDVPSGSFTFTGIVGEFRESYQLTPIETTDIFETGGGSITINDARQESDGTQVVVEGIVTRKDGLNVYLQDDSGATGASGIVARDGDLADAYDMGDVNPGDRIRVSGGLGSFSGLIQIGSNVSFEVVTAGAGLPTPQSISISDVLNGGGEDYESELVTISGLTVDAAGDSNFQGDTNYDATDGTDTITLRISDQGFYDGQPIPSGAVTYRGVLGQFNGGFGGARLPDEGYQLLPLIDGDLE